MWDCTEERFCDNNLCRQLYSVSALECEIRMYIVCKIVAVLVLSRVLNY